jgi:hypothetical protein
MFIGASGSKVFRPQQGDQHVDGHSDRRGDVEDGDQHRSDPAKQDGVDGEQPEHGGAERDKDEIHEDKAPVSGADHIRRRRIKFRRLCASSAINET